MIRKDYIMRMVEEFAKFLAAVIALRNEGKFEEALDKIDAIYKGMINIDPKVIRSMGPDEVLDYLQKDKEFENQYIKLVAELLYEEGQIYHESGDPVSALNVLEKAKILIDHLIESDKTFAFDWYEKIAVIDKIISA